MTRLHTIALTAGVVVFFLLISLAQEVNREWQIQREIQILEAQVHEERTAISQLENLNQYFRTDDFQERLAREKLNYRAPGEEVVLIPDKDLSNETNEVIRKEEEAETPTYRQWWDVFFNATL